ncbi:hypothetical protein Ddye_029874 [Dipteronia dyeriana]|uniref:S-protein homolog n=1 Tax=Dipteronia dyeriana TaxID=168575 RepID=A0AAD9TFX4_9ROSI|nr:hypothetical protein Ddye_029874 [Dipteronia dyeriana]
MAGWLAENTVVIKNGFRSNAKSLYVHCHSTDKDLGEHWLARGQKYSWSFNVNIWMTTRFDCYVQWGSKKKSFKAYDFSGYYCCVDKGIVTWTIREDGLLASSKEKDIKEDLAFLHWN